MSAVLRPDQLIEKLLNDISPGRLVVTVDAQEVDFFPLPTEPLFELSDEAAQKEMSVTERLDLAVDFLDGWLASRRSLLLRHVWSNEQGGNGQA